MTGLAAMLALAAAVPDAAAVRAAVDRHLYAALIARLDAAWP